jgi:GT2 family glycosyltransferase
LEYATGDIIFTINQDVILTENFIEKIIEYFESAPDSVGTVGGKILRMNAKTIDSAGLKLSRSRRFFDQGSEEKDSGQFEKTEEVFGICAAAAAYRKTMLDKISGFDFHNCFDERFYLLVEDVDLAWRARHSGYRAIYHPEAVCYHVRGGAGWRNKNKQYLSFRNRCFLLIKNEYLINYFWAFPWFLCYDCSRLIYLMFSNKLVWKAIREIFRELPSLLRERRLLLKNSKMKPFESRRWMK